MPQEINADKAIPLQKECREPHMLECVERKLMESAPAGTASYAQKLELQAMCLPETVRKQTGKASDSLTRLGSP